MKFEKKILMVIVMMVLTMMMIMMIMMIMIMMMMMMMVMVMNFFYLRNSDAEMNPTTGTKENTVQLGGLKLND